MVDANVELKKNSFGDRFIGINRSPVILRSNLMIISDHNAQLVVGFITSKVVGGCGSRAVF